MARNTGNDYFKMMAETAVCAKGAADKLKDILENFTPATLDGSMREMHDIEHHGDDLKHQLVAKLVREFITPIEREDIMALVDQTDDVIDSIEDVVLKMYMYNIREVLPEAVRFAEIVCACAGELVVVFEEFADFKKSKKIQASIIEINRLEEDGDTLYVNAVRKLYEGDVDPVRATAWTEVFTCLEKCCDMCEHAADLVSNVIMKNT